MSTNIFEQASRKRLTFPSVVGNLTVSDLWNLPLRTTRSNKASLENVGNAILKDRKDVGDESIFGVDTPSPERVKQDLQIAIVRHIIGVITAENAAKTAVAATKSQKATLDAIIAERSAKETPLEDLIKQREALNL